MRLNRRGDTLIEVMIVLAVLGLALSISYATANRALLNTRQAQETADATRLAETQIERLRAVSPHAFTLNPDTNIYGRASSFCLALVSGSVRVFTNPNTNCSSLNRSGVNVSGGFYNIEVREDSSIPNQFAISVTWPNVRGDDIDTVKMSYRVYARD